MIGPHDALIYTMVLVAAADGDINDRELATMGTLVSTLPVFADWDKNRLATATEDCARLMAEEEGLETALGLISADLPHKLHETAYLVACEVAAADHALVQEELRLLELVRHRLEIDRLHAAAIERGVRARFTTL